MNVQYRDMQQFDWIYKSFVGIFGTTTAFMLDNVSVIVSILAGVATILYMMTQFINEIRRGRWEKQDRYDK